MRSVVPHAQGDAGARNGPDRYWWKRDNAGVCARPFAQGRLSRLRWLVLSAGISVALTSTASSSFANVPPYGPPISPGCILRKLTQVPLIPSGGHDIIPATLDDKPVSMLLDTGAAMTALTVATLDDLHLPHDRARSIVVFGIGRKLDAQYPAFVRSLKVGEVEWFNTDSVGIAGLSSEGQGAPAGLIGTDLLWRYDVELDFPGHTLTLWDAAGCSDRFVPWKGEYAALRLVPSRSRGFIVPVELDGHVLRAIIDTGADATSTTMSAALAAGAAPDALAADKAGLTAGAVGGHIATRTHVFDHLTIGPITLHRPAISVIEERWTDNDILIGMDVLRGRRIWFSYASGQIFIQQAVEADRAPVSVTTRDKDSKP